MITPTDEIAVSRRQVRRMHHERDVRRASWEESCSTGKRGFRSEKHAQLALESTQLTAEAGFANRHETRFYVCPCCHRYHLTSRA